METPYAASFRCSNDSKESNCLPGPAGCGVACEAVPCVPIWVFPGARTAALSQSRATARIDELAQAPGLAAVMPLLFTVWADAELDDNEMRQVGEGAASFLSGEEQEVLATWLDPAHPPTAGNLLRLRRAVREIAQGIDGAPRLTLSELGVEIAGAGADGVDADLHQIADGLARIERGLGLVGHEATASVLDTGLPEPMVVPPVEGPASFDVGALRTRLEGPWAKYRQRAQEILSRPEFASREQLGTHAERERVLGWLRILADEGLGDLAFPGVTTDRGPGPFFAVFEALASFDASLMTKFGVQFGLFGGSIFHLGTDEQRARYLPAVATLELPGCFAMSELGHGSNVRDLETTATYDADADELVVHTPAETSRKEWIGNAAAHGHMATVFAQLVVAGESQGVHAVLVPLRDATGATAPGVRIQDCGRKAGLNGVDNGRIWFDQVRVPRANLLSRFGRIRDDGGYESEIASPGRRFFTMLRTLVGGRIAVGSSGVTTARCALTIAVRYTARRTQFGPPGGPDTPILDYRTQQLRLMPRLARAYALGFAGQRLLDRFVDHREDEAAEIEALAAGFKAVATRNCTETIQICREACGGQGYLASNRLGSLRADSDIFTTYEGDNTVLLQLVARGRLASFKAQFGDSKLLGTVRHLAAQASTAVTELNPVVTRQRSDEHLLDPEFQKAALRYREEQLVASLAGRLKHRIDAGIEPFDAFNQCQDHAIAAARATVECDVLEAMHGAVVGGGPRSQIERLRRMRDLYALSEIHGDSWFLRSGYVEPPKAKAIRDLVARLCAELRPDAVALVDAFGIPDHCIGAPIALGASSG